MKSKMKYTESKLKELAQDFLEWIKQEGNIYYKDWCNEQGFSPQRISEFCEKSEEFKEAYDIGKQIQESKLVKGGLQGKLNVTMAIFCLKNNHGFSDKNETKHSGSLSLSDIFNL